MRAVQKKQSSKVKLSRETNKFPASQPLLALKATFVRSFLAFSSLSISIFWAFAEKEQKLQEALETLKSYHCLTNSPS